jgi:hypothetical protein
MRMMFLPVCSEVRGFQEMTFLPVHSEANDSMSSWSYMSTIRLHGSMIMFHKLMHLHVQR